MNENVKRLEREKEQKGKKKQNEKRKKERIGKIKMNYNGIYLHSLPWSLFFYKGEKYQKWEYCFRKRKKTKQLKKKKRKNLKRETERKANITRMFDNTKVYSFSLLHCFIILARCYPSFASNLLFFIISRWALEFLKAAPRFRKYQMFVNAKNRPEQKWSHSEKKRLHITIHK